LGQKGMIGRLLGPLATMHPRRGKMSQEKESAKGATESN